MSNVCSSYVIITDKIKNSESVVLFEYQGLTVAEVSELRKKLRDADATVKVYKNTLLKRALDEQNISFEGFLEGPNAILFGKDLSLLGDSNKIESNSLPKVV